jgi:hypothetical protein
MKPSLLVVQQIVHTIQDHDCCLAFWHGKGKHNAIAYLVLSFAENIRTRAGSKTSSPAADDPPNHVLT